MGRGARGAMGAAPRSLGLGGGAGSLDGEGRPSGGAAGVAGGRAADGRQAFLDGKAARKLRALGRRGPARAVGERGAGGQSLGRAARRGADGGADGAGAAAVKAAAVASGGEGASRSRCSLVWRDNEVWECSDWDDVIDGWSGWGDDGPCCGDDHDYYPPTCRLCGLGPSDCKCFSSLAYWFPEDMCKGVGRYVPDGSFPCRDPEVAAVDLVEPLEEELPPLEPAVDPAEDAAIAPPAGPHKRLSAGPARPALGVAATMWLPARPRRAPAPRHLVPSALLLLLAALAALAARGL